MKIMLRTLAIAGTLASAMLAACSQEVSHTESTKSNMLGGTTHKETTVYKNPDGTLSTEHTEHTQRP